MNLFSHLFDLGNLHENNFKYLWIKGVFTANWFEARMIKYTNFPAKYMNSRSKLHWNIHVVLCLVSVTWNNRWGIGISELCDHAEHHSTFNSSPKYFVNYLLLWYFFGIFPINVVSASILTSNTTTKLALITKLQIVRGRPFYSEGGAWHFLEINILTLKILDINNLSYSGKKINNLT